MVSETPRGAQEKGRSVVGHLWLRGTPLCAAASETIPGVHGKAVRKQQMQHVCPAFSAMFLLAATIFPQEGDGTKLHTQKK